MMSQNRDFQARANRPEVLTDELVRCCFYSSVRGVPRILRSRHVLWRFIWLVSVIGLLSGAIVSVYFLAEEYLKYKDIQVTRRYLHNPLPFPSVTVCNLKPFSENRLKNISETRTDVNISGIIDRIQHAATNHTDLLGDYTKRDLLFASLGLRVSREIGYSQEDFILNGTCLYHERRNWKNNYNSCKNVTVIQHPNFFNCFLFQPDNEASNFTLKLEMILNLDTDRPLACVDKECSNGNTRNIMRDDNAESSIGARILVHTPGTFPQIGEKGVDILPGSKSSIEFFPVEEVILETPRTTCINFSTFTEVSPSVARGDDDNSNHFVHSVGLCKDLQIQENIVTERCNCVSTVSPRGPKHAHLPFCFHIKDNDTFRGDDFERRARCELGVISKYERKAVKCEISCWWLKYQYKVYQSKWPAKYKELDFYRTYIRNNSKLSSKFREYEEIIKLSQNPHTLEKARRKLLETHLIEENFVRVKIFRPDFSSMKMSESLVMTLPSLLSQIGGMFSLWCGLSIITVVELFELAFYCFKRLTNCTNLHSGGQSSIEEDEHREKNSFELNARDLSIYSDTVTSQPDHKAATYKLS